MVADALRRAITTETTVIVVLIRQCRCPGLQPDGAPVLTVRSSPLSVCAPVEGSAAVAPLRARPTVPPVLALPYVLACGLRGETRRKVHMATVEHDLDRGWHDARVQPFGPLPILPGASVCSTRGRCSRD